MKDLGQATHIFGMRIDQDRKEKPFVSQEKYIDKVLAEFQMTNAKSSSIPLQPQMNISKADKTINTKEELEEIMWILDVFSGGNTS